MERCIETHILDILELFTNIHNEYIQSYCDNDTIYSLNIIDENINFIHKLIIDDNQLNLYNVEINKISDLDNVLLYYKNINILEYCYTQIFFKENFNKKLCSYYKTELNFNFNEKLNLIVKILYIKNNILISNKVYIIFKSIHYRLNKI